MLEFAATLFLGLTSLCSSAPYLAPAVCRTDQQLLPMVKPTATNCSGENDRIDRMLQPIEEDRFLWLKLLAEQVGIPARGGDSCRLPKLDTSWKYIAAHDEDTDDSVSDLFPIDSDDAHIARSLCSSYQDADNIFVGEPIAWCLSNTEWRTETGKIVSGKRMLQVRVVKVLRGSLTEGGLVYFDSFVSQDRGRPAVYFADSPNDCYRSGLLTYPAKAGPCLDSTQGREGWAGVDRRPLCQWVSMALVLINNPKFCRRIYANQG